MLAKSSANSKPRSKPNSPVRAARRTSLFAKLRELNYGLRLDGGGYQRLRWWGFSKAEANSLIDELAALGCVRLGVQYGTAFVAVVPDEEAGE